MREKASDWETYIFSSIFKWINLSLDYFSSLYLNMVYIGSTHSWFKALFLSLCVCGGQHMFVQIFTILMHIFLWMYRPGDPKDKGFHQVSVPMQQTFSVEDIEAWLNKSSIFQQLFTGIFRSCFPLDVSTLPFEVHKWRALGVSLRFDSYFELGCMGILGVNV